MAKGTEFDWWRQEGHFNDHPEPPTEIRTHQNGAVGIKGGLCCADCKTALPAHKLYLVTLSDWQGGVWVRCFECQQVASVDDDDLRVTLTETGFQRTCRYRWKMRAEMAGKQLQNERSKSWDQVKADITARHPGETAVEYRRRLKDGIVDIAEAVAHAFSAMSNYDRTRIEEAYVEQEKHLEEMSMDDTHVAQYATTEHFWAPERILDYASKLVEGLDEYYACRNESRLCFAPNTMRVQTQGLR